MIGEKTRVPGSDGHAYDPREATRMQADERRTVVEVTGDMDRLKTRAFIKGWALRSCTSAVPPYPGSLSTALVQR